MHIQSHAIRVADATVELLSIFIYEKFILRNHHLPFTIQCTDDFKYHARNKYERDETSATFGAHKVKLRNKSHINKI